MSQRIHTLLLLVVLLGVGWLVVVGPREQPTVQAAPQPIGRYSLQLKGSEEVILDTATGDVYSFNVVTSGVFVVLKMNLPTQRVEVYPMQVDPKKERERVLEYYRKNPPQPAKP